MVMISRANSTVWFSMVNVKWTFPVSDRLKYLTTLHIHAHIHTLLTEAATQGANQLIKRG